MSEPAEFRHLAEIADLVSLQGLDVADIGCGSGELVRLFARQAGTCVGVECDAGQLAGLTGPEGPEGPGGNDDPAGPVSLGARYLEGTGQALPLATGTLDLVCYCYSLHHVPVAQMGLAIKEARRVSRPGGLLCVIEPEAAGELYQLDSLIDDEGPVRAAAQQALDKAAAGADETGAPMGEGALMREIARRRYETSYVYETLDRLIDEMIALDPARKGRALGNRGELMRRFAALGESPDRGAGRRAGTGTDPGPRRFAQPNLLRLFRFVA